MRQADEVDRRVKARFDATIGAVTIANCAVRIAHGAATIALPPMWLPPDPRLVKPAQVIV